MTARSAVAPTMTSQVIKNSLHVGSGFAEQMDPMELSSLNELLVASPPCESLRTMIGSGLNPTKGRLTLRRSPIRYRWWRSNVVILPLF